MRTLSILMVAAVMLLAVSTAAADSFRKGNDQVVTNVPETQPLGSRGHATLKLSPMFLEIHEVNETSLATEQKLLKQLASCQDEHEVERLVARLERLDTDRQLSVLRIRVKFAQLAGQYDLVFRLRQDILRLMQQEMAPLM